MHGIPVLNAPISLEQRILADNIESMGAGLTVTAKTGAGTGEAASRLLNEPSFRSAAKAFAARQDKYRERTYETRVMAELENLVKI